MAGAVDRIEEFPKDGRLWWIRWVDHYQVPHRATATSSVEVLLEPLDTSLGQLRKISLKSLFKSQDHAQQNPVRVLTGYIPRLVIGTVFQDGVEVGCLPLSTESFKIQAPSISVHGVKDEIPSKPEWWTFAYRVINRGDYQLQSFPDSKAVVIDSDSAVLVIALTSGPWEHTASSVLVPEETGIRKDGRWQIVLRRDIRNQHANILANLWLSDVGRTAANSIYKSFLSKAGPAHMAVSFPFHLSQLHLEAKGVWLEGSPAKFLALQITGMEWPVKIETVYQRQNSGDKGKTQTQTDKPKPYSTTGTQPAVDEEGIIDANSAEDPSAASEATGFHLEAIDWIDEPKLIKAQKLESFKYSESGTKNDEESLQGVSPGEKWHGGTSSGSATYSAHERRDPSKRFAEIAHMLDRLKSSGSIQHWDVVPHPNPFLSVGPLSVWHFPKTLPGSKKEISFSFLDSTTRRRRGALVCELRYKGHIVYWLEIEVSPNGGGFRSLVFAAPLAIRNQSIHHVIRIAAQKRGVWPDADDITHGTGVSWAEFWQHSYIGKTAKTKGRLNEARALEAIANVARNDSEDNTSQKSQWIPATGS